MPYNAINALKIGTDWTNACTFESSQDIEKIDINVMEVAVLLQFLEGEDRVYPVDEKQYILLRLGFHSVPFATPIRRYRLRQWNGDPNYGKNGANGKPCEVDVREFM